MVSILVAMKPEHLPPMLHRPPHPFQVIIYRHHVELLRMELPTSPTTEMREFVMPRLKDHRQEFLIA
jgi:hypothetical protein